MENIDIIIDLLDCSIKEEPENSITAGEIIKAGYDNQVDDYRNTIQTANDWLADYQRSLIEKTGISTLKIKHTSVSGYFIEVSKAQTSNIDETFIQKQTLVNACRYITPELEDFHARMAEAQEKKASREYEIFSDIREEVLWSFHDLAQVAQKSAYIDFIVSLSKVAYSNNYHKPSISKGYDLQILSGRHPVIEQSGNEFISNDLHLEKKDFVHIITWPNMWWKSTFLRQNALIILLAHMWSFVPAKQANIPLTDKIFSRVWASDNLFLWQSTFMVEMQEIAHILNNSTKQSFVIIDEVGRGTATYDGMSLAWAILKHNHDTIGAKTLFATHYHELIDESKQLSWVNNFSVAVGENDQNLVFLRKIISGGMKKSYGLEVAKIAGVHREVIQEARHMLHILESNHTQNSQMNLWDITPMVSEVVIKQTSLIEEELWNIDINNLTPMQALQALWNLQNNLKNNEK